MKNCNKSQNINNVTAVLLTANRDFGRCQLATNLNPALWNVLGQTVLNRILQQLKLNNISKTVICANSSLLQIQRSIKKPEEMDIKVIGEKLPLGSAGVLKKAASHQPARIFIVISAQTMNLPPLNPIIKKHIQSNAHLSVLTACDRSNFSDGNSQIFICSDQILKYIPDCSFMDIKEGLIPKILSNSGNVKAIFTNTQIKSFHNRQSYLNAICCGFEQNLFDNLLLEYKKTANNIWIGKDARIENNVKIFPPAIIMNNSQIDSGSIIIGPAVIEPDVIVAENSVISSSILWQKTRIGKNSLIESSIINKNVEIPPNTNICSQAVHETKKSTPIKLLAVLIISAAFLWSYWPGILDLANIFKRSDEYSSGFLVPFLAIYVLWTRRKDLLHLKPKPCLWGAAAFVAAQVFRYFGLYYMYASAQRLSIILSLAALCILFLGLKIFAKLIPIFIFLGLMLPLPRSIHNSIMLPLQQAATASSVFLLEMLGFSAFREGNIININGVSVAVVEACNGLRMVTAFFIVIGLVILIIKKPLIQKILLALSSLPIALLCNTIRLTLTAIAFSVLQQKKWEMFFHDFGGYAMMPLAIAIVIAEIWFLSKLTQSNQIKPQPVIINRKIYKQEVLK